MIHCPGPGARAARPRRMAPRPGGSPDGTDAGPAGADDFVVSGNRNPEICADPGNPGQPPGWRGSSGGDRRITLNPAVREVSAFQKGLEQRASQRRVPDPKAADFRSPARGERGVGGGAGVPLGLGWDQGIPGMGGPRTDSKARIRHPVLNRLGIRTTWVDDARQVRSAFQGDHRCKRQ